MASLASSQSIRDFAELLEDEKNILEIVKSAQDANKNSAGLSDKTFAVAKGVNSFLSLPFLPQSVTIVAERLGHIFGVVDVLRATGDMLGDLGFLMFASRFGGDPAVLQEATADIDKKSVDLYFASAKTALGALGMVPAIEASVAGKITIQGLDFALTNVEVVRSALDQEAGDTAVNVAGRMTNPFPSRQQGFAQVNGTANITNSQGVAAAPSSPDLCCFGASNLGIVGLADSVGGYSLFVPLAVPNTNYANVTLSVQDLISGQTLSSATVDLRGLDSSRPVQMPTLTGSCSDFDALFPDADDPDCD